MGEWCSLVHMHGREIKKWSIYDNRGSIGRIHCSELLHFCNLPVEWVCERLIRAAVNTEQDIQGAAQIDAPNRTSPLPERHPLLGGLDFISRGNSGCLPVLSVSSQYATIKFSRASVADVLRPTDNAAKNRAFNSEFVRMLMVVSTRRLDAAGRVLTTFPL